MKLGKVVDVLSYIIKPMYNFEFIKENVRVTYIIEYVKCNIMSCVLLI